MPNNSEHVVGKYDKNHTITVSKSLESGRVTLIFFNRNNKKKFRNSDMQRNFLTLYGLTEQDIQSCNSPAEFDSRLRCIERHNRWCHDLVMEQGINYIKQQHKRQPIHNQPISEISPSSILGELDNLVRNLTLDYANNLRDGKCRTKLPVLEACIRILKHPIYSDHYRSAINNSLIIITQQGFSTVEHMIQALLDLGIPSQNIILFTKPHTTTTNNAKKFKRLGINFIEPELLEDPSPSTYKQAIIKSVEKVVDTAREHLEGTPNIKNIILHDEGGSITKSNAFKNWIKLIESDYHICTSEHTISGLGARKNSPLPAPCISMAESFIKIEYEASMIAEASFLAVENDIKHLLEQFAQAGRAVLKIGVIGCGNIGSEFIKRLVNRFANQKPVAIELHISELEPTSEKFCETKKFISKMNAAGQLIRCKYYIPTGNELKNRYEHANQNAADIIQSANIVFGCTGKDITKQLIKEVTSTPHETVLYSVSSGYREFESLFDNTCVYNEQKRECHRTLNRLKLVIKNWGRPINFNGRDDAVDPFQIQLIRAATVGVIMLDLSHVSLSADMSASSNTDNIKRLSKYNHDKKEKPFTILDPALQLFLGRWFKISQETLRSIYHIDRTNQPEAFKLALVDTAFFNRKLSLNEIKRGSGGGANMEMDHAKPHEYNYIGQYDKNHKIFLLDENGELRFRIVKHGRVLIDNKMREKFLISRGSSLTQYQDASKTVAKQIAKNNTARLLKSFSSLFNVSLTPEEKLMHASKPIPMN